MIIRAVINALLGDGHIDRRPSRKQHGLIWMSTCREWLEWKQQNLIPTSLKSQIYIHREANSKSCFANSKTLYGLRTQYSNQINKYSSWSKQEALCASDLLDLAIWFLDDGCTISRRTDSPGSYRVTLCVGDITADDLFPEASRILGLRPTSLGRVYKNNSRATERNKSWIMTKAAAVQIMREARNIAPPDLQYKVPLW